MKITDVDKNTSAEYFTIEVNDKHIIEVNFVEFFDFLEFTGRIDGHDARKETAWISSNRVIWNPQRQEPEEVGGHESRSYQEWMEDFVYEDEILMAYLVSLLAITSRMEVKAEAA